MNHYSAKWYSKTPFHSYFSYHVCSINFGLSNRLHLSKYE